MDGLNASDSITQADPDESRSPNMLFGFSYSAQTRLIAPFGCAFDSGVHRLPPGDLFQADRSPVRGAATPTAALPAAGAMRNSRPC